MTAKERNECVDACEHIQALDIEALAAKQYNNLKLEELEQFSLPEVINMLKRAVKQLLNQLQTDNWKLLPNEVSDPAINLTGAKQNVAKLEDQISFIHSSLLDEDSFTNWLPELLFVVRYEMHHGFWDRAEARVHSPDELALSEAQTEVGLLIQQLKNGLNEASEAHKRLEEKTQSINEFQLLKEKQFTDLDENLDSLKILLSSVQESEKQAAVGNGKISTLLEQSDKTLEASRKKIAQDRKTFHELESHIDHLTHQFSQQLQDLNVQSESFDGLIDSAREKEQNILAQEKEIMRLIGHAADGRLATAFNDREKAVSSRVDWWRTASLWVVLLAICWIVAIFFISPIQSQNGINWAIMVANIVRTAPAFILVFFCQSQYTKERNIQEEYAFKAAVSRTVTSYADMIGTGEVNERVKMLVDTIQRIYSPPVLGKSVEPISLKSEHIAQTAKSMSDTAQNLKSAVTDILKPSKSTPEV
ncbi:hypothetical protein [uncultured Hymenobacter sp.]|uniref:hypothetical protein n=1 Tax=uncultured Hymenobacter sp. TaxID=170016 RepID=UPI0035CA1C99